MELLDVLRVIRRRWWAIVLATMVAVLAAAGPILSAPTTPPGLFTAQHLLYSGGGRAGGIGLPTLAALSRTGEIPGRVADRLGQGATARTVVAGAQVRANEEQGTISILATGRDPERTARVANLYAEEIQQYLIDRQEDRRTRSGPTQAELDAVQDQVRDIGDELASLEPGSSEALLLTAERDMLLDRYRTLLAEANQTGPSDGGLETLQVATPILRSGEDGMQLPQSPLVRLGVAGVIGLLLGVALAFLLDRVDTRIRSRDEAEAAFRLPVVTEVPRLGMRDRRRPSVIMAAKPTSHAAESFRTLRLSLQLMPRWILPLDGPSDNDLPRAGSTNDHTRRAQQGAPRVIMVTSPRGGDGKTVTAVNLAASFAELGRSVVLLDIDLRHASTHRYLKVPERPGVTDLLVDPDALGGLASLLRETTVPGVRALLAGTAVGNPGELLGHAGELIREAGEQAEVVVIDSGPLLDINDAATLVPYVDAVVMVGRSGSTSADDAERSTELLARIAAPILGVALVGVPGAIIEHGYFDPHVAPMRRHPDETSEQRQVVAHGARRTADSGLPSSASRPQRSDPGRSRARRSR